MEQTPSVLWKLLSVTTRLDIPYGFRDFINNQEVPITLLKHSNGKWTISTHTKLEARPDGYYNPLYGPLLDEEGRIAGTFDYHRDSPELYFDLLEALRHLGGRWKDIADILQKFDTQTQDGT